jgi:glycosyltransferase involved in cell wall biosynthesis
MIDIHNLFVSVIIPVFNDAQHLKICLEALEKQSYQKNLYEVIVVDNASDPKENIAGVVSQFPQARTVYESHPGSYAARNKGISLSKGDVIAFTDADCIPALDWIEKGVKNLLRVPNCGLVAGKIQVFCKNPNQITPVELYEKILALPQQQFLEKDKYGATANVFTFRSVLETVGCFDEKLKSSGDLEWGQRVYSFGYKQIYAEDTCVAHPARSSFEQIYKRTIRLAGGFYDLRIRKESSFFKRNIIYLNNLFKNLIPPLMWMMTTFSNQELKKIDEKLKVAIVMVFIRYVYAWEMIRLKLGRVSARE